MAPAAARISITRSAAEKAEEEKKGSPPPKWSPPSGRDRRCNHDHPCSVREKGASRFDQLAYPTKSMLISKLLFNSTYPTNDEANNEATRLVLRTIRYAEASRPGAGENHIVAIMIIPCYQ